MRMVSGRLNLLFLLWRRIPTSGV